MIIVHLIVLLNAAWFITRHKNAFCVKIKIKIKVKLLFLKIN